MLQKNRVRRAALPFLGCALGFLIMGIATMIQQNMRAGAGWFEFLSGIGFIIVGCITALNVHDENLERANHEWALWRTDAFVGFFLVWAVSVVMTAAGAVVIVESKNPNAGFYGMMTFVLGFTVIRPSYMAFIPKKLVPGMKRINVPIIAMSWLMIIAAGVAQHILGGRITWEVASLYLAGIGVYITSEIMNFVVVDSDHIEYASWSTAQKILFAKGLWLGYFCIGVISFKPGACCLEYVLVWIALLVFASTVITCTITVLLPKQQQ